MRRTMVIVITCILLLAAPSAAQTDASVDYVLDNTKERLLALIDFSAQVEITQLQNSRVVRTKAKIAASQEHKLARLQIFEPSILEGQIVVADQNTLEVKTYLPVADQIMVRRAEDMAADAGLGIDFTNLASVFDFSDLRVIIHQVIAGVNGDEYVLEVTGYEEQLQYVWIGHDWIPYQVEVYDGCKLIGTMTFQDISIDQGLSEDYLLELPNVRRVHY